MSRLCISWLGVPFAAPSHFAHSCVPFSSVCVIPVKRFRYYSVDRKQNGIEFKVESDVSLQSPTCMPSQYKDENNVNISSNHLEFLIENTLLQEKHTHNSHLYTEIARRTKVDRSQIIRLVRKIRNRSKRKRITESHKEFVLNFIYRNENKYQSNVKLYDDLQKELSLPREQIYTLVSYARRKLIWKTPTAEQKEKIKSFVQQELKHKLKSSAYTQLEESTGLSRKQLYHIVKSIRKNLSQQKIHPSTKMEKVILRHLLRRHPARSSDAVAINTLNSSLNHILKQLSMEPTDSLIESILKKYDEKRKKQHLSSSQKYQIANLITSNLNLSNQALYQLIESKTSLPRSQLYHIVQRVRMQNIMNHLSLEEKNFIRLLLQDEHTHTNHEAIVETIINHSNLSRNEATFLVQCWKPPKYVFKVLSKDEKEEIHSLLTRAFHNVANIKSDQNEGSIRDTDKGALYTHRLATKSNSLLYDCLQDKFHLPRAQARNIIHDFISKKESKRITKEDKFTIIAHLKNWLSDKSFQDAKDKKQIRALYDELEKLTSLSRKQVRAQVLKRLPQVLEESFLIEHGNVNMRDRA